MTLHFLYHVLLLHCNNITHAQLKPSQKRCKYESLKNSVRRADICVVRAVRRKELGHMGAEGISP